MLHSSQFRISGLCRFMTGIVNSATDEDIKRRDAAVPPAAHFAECLWLRVIT